MAHALPNYMEGYISVNDIEIFYSRFGQTSQEAPTLLLLHGGWATGQLNWSSHYTYLCQHFDVISLDWRGHGKTNNPAGKFTGYSRLAWDVIGFCQALKIDKPIIMGHSSGAIISLLISIFDPTLLQRQILIGIHPFMGISKSHHKGMRDFFATADHKVPPKKWRHIFRFPLRSITLWRVHRKTPWFQLLKQSWSMWSAPLNLSVADYKKIICPTLVVIGLRDEFGTLCEAQNFTTLIDTAIVQGVPKADHMFVMNNPNYLKAHIMNFLVMSF